MKIEVTQEHIDKGEQDDCYNCPVALALEAKEIYNFAVEEETLCDIYTENRIKLPLQVVEFIENFDFGEEVKPFSFEIEL